MKHLMPDGELVEMQMPLFKTPYNHNTNFESDRTALYCKDPSMTKQEFMADADINNILAKFLRLGEAPPITLPEHFMDLSQRTTYYDTASQIAETNKLFYNLPARTRAVYANDPTRWADAVVQAVEQNDRQTLLDAGIELPDVPQDPPTPPVPPVPAAKAEGAPGAPKGP
ncbi:internal scaffolding protein [robinz microvirus RP_71]|nr:internal scaffolding protein [robinz microvirus RP_71]